MSCSLQVVAANQKVEEANAKRQQESERSLQALQQKSADTYSKQVPHLNSLLGDRHVAIFESKLNSVLDIDNVMGSEPRTPWIIAHAALTVVTLVQSDQP